MIDTLFGAVCGCGSRYVEWRDCERHENDCYVLMCYSCGFDDYDCSPCNCGQTDPLPVAHDDGCPVWEQARQKQLEREMTNVQD